MSTYTKSEIETLWIAEGGDPSAANVASAVALAESGGDPTQTYKNTDGSTDRGLFQINSVHGTQSTTSLIPNVRAAISISNNGKNWQPWVTYTTGKYRAFLSATNAVLPQESLTEFEKNHPNQVGGASITSTALAGPKAVAGAAASVANIPLQGLKLAESTIEALFNSSTWFRIGKVLIGVFLGLFGIVIITRKTGAADTITNVASKAALA